MSTKIYNGFKFKSKNIKEILEQLKSIQKQAIEKVNERITLSRIEHIFVVHDNFPNMDYWDISKKIMSDLDKKWRDYSTLDYSFSVIIYPDKKNVFYGAYFSDHQDLPDMLNEFIEDFHFQNSTDKPKEITRNEWRFREKKWNELLPTGRFSDNGFKFEIVSSNDVDDRKIREYCKEILKKIDNNNQKEIQKSKTQSMVELKEKIELSKHINLENAFNSSKEVFEYRRKLAEAFDKAPGEFETKVLMESIDYANDNLKKVFGIF